MSPEGLSGLVERKASLRWLRHPTEAALCTSGSDLFTGLEPVHKHPR